MTRVYLSAATSALSADHAPVGGGVAVLEALIPELARQDFDLTLLSPGRTDARHGIRQALAVPTLSDADPDRLLQLNARGYAQFAIEWEHALNRYFGDVPSDDAVVIANDVSEGPPFAELHRRGFRQIVLFHVVVAEFFARRYVSQPLKLPVRGAHLASLWRAAERIGIDRAAPDVARLVWRKEGDAARYADTCIAPSQPLARSLADCYPDTTVADRTHIVPWGVTGDPDPARRDQRRDTLRAQGVDHNRFVLLTLSRISPEKRIDLLIEALRLIETQSPSTADQLALVVAGAPAYMGGASYFQRIQRLATQLRRVPVHFPGYVVGDDKWDLFAAADLFCSPSFYEAYGLTIAQALASGTPVLAAPHAGARATIAPDRGWIADPDPAAMAAAIRRAAAQHETRRIQPMRGAAAQWGAAHPFADAASRIAQLIRTLTRTNLEAHQ